MTTPDQAISPLVADIMTAMMSQTHDVTNNIIESLTARADHSEAEIDAIRAGIQTLLDGPYMPTPDAILRALYPSAEMVDRFHRDGEN